MKNIIIKSNQPRHAACLCLCEIREDKIGDYGIFKNGVSRDGNIKLNKLYDCILISEYDHSDEETKNRVIKCYGATIRALKCSAEFKNKNPVSGNVTIHVSADKCEEITL